mmetsp:Transcript_65515/g.152129  ORF Transcript_65515/g.152129 Transcript_65515/m.152129 type:complete len:168 (-) Transcript_65515:74-577(-)
MGVIQEQTILGPEVHSHECMSTLQEQPTFGLQFQCRQCMNIIQDGQPVYMGEDSSYCSIACRRRRRQLGVVELDGYNLAGTEMTTLDGSSDKGPYVAVDNSSSSSSVAAPVAQKPLERAIMWAVSAAMRKLVALAKRSRMLPALSDKAVQAWETRLGLNGSQAVRCS